MSVDLKTVKIGDFVRVYVDEYIKGDGVVINIDRWSNRVRVLISERTATTSSYVWDRIYVRDIEYGYVNCYSILHVYEDKQAPMALIAAHAAYVAREVERDAKRAALRRQPQSFARAIGLPQFD